MVIKNYLQKNSNIYLSLSCFLIISFSTNIISDTITPITKKVFIESSNNISDSKKPIPDIVIYKDSIVVRDEADSIGISESILKIGDYKFAIDNLTEIRAALVNINNGFFTKSTNKLKVGKFNNGQYIFITGSIFIKFYNFLDTDSVATEYNLILKKNLSSGSFKTFQIQDISSIELIVESLRNDPRVELVEYDFINPLIQAN